MKTNLRKNSKAIIILVIIAAFLFVAARGMSGRDVLITVLRGFSTGSVTFLVAAGFSLIFGLLDVLNLAQGTLYMIGAYVGWTVYVRPDTFIDVLTPVLLILAGFSLSALWGRLASRIQLAPKARKIISWLLILAGFGLLALVLTRYPIAIWNLNNYSESPITYSYMADQGLRIIPAEVTFEKISPFLALAGLLVSSAISAFGIALLNRDESRSQTINWRNFLVPALLLLGGILAVVFNAQITSWMYAMSTNCLFVIAILIAILSGVGLGALMETTLIRPLYNRPIYQLMLTLGLGTIGLQIVQAVWGRPEFVWPKPEFFTGTGGACPATNLADLLEYNCSTVFLLGGRVRVYDEIFIPIVGIIVLIVVWILLKRSRIGMIIRAGVQDRQMVEALGINVRRVFTLVFALGVGLATFGDALAAPSTGLTPVMGERLLLSALIALAIGGLTSFPGAALGSLLVGLIQQFMIKYGQIGIPLPFTDAVFKPSPPLVPASTVLLMVIVLLILPGGLLGSKE